MERRERYWTFIVYPESVPDNWKDILQKTGLQFAISPLHDKDLNPTGEYKKAHYHVIMIFKGPASYKVAESITKEVNGTIPQSAKSPIGLIRYMTHKDNPEKAQYDERDITTINGLDIQDVVGLTTTQVNQMKMAIIKLCQAKKIDEYSTLINFLIKEDMYDLFDVASSHTIFVNAYLKSKHFNIDEELKK